MIGGQPCQVPTATGSPTSSPIADRFNAAASRLALATVSPTGAQAAVDEDIMLSIVQMISHER